MKHTSFVLLLFITTLIISCRTPRFIYSPAPPNNPYFREKGESRLAAYYSSAPNENDLEPEDEYNHGFDLQAAYAISDNWALTADYFKRKEKDVFFNYNRSLFDSSIVRYNRNLTSFGLGFFTPLTNDKQIVFNIFGGLGFGKFSFTDNGFDNVIAHSREYQSNMSKWYIQPAFNFFPGKYFRTALIGKISWVHYSNVTTSYTTPELEYFDLHLLSGNTITFFEATCNMQVTFKNMKWFCLDGGITFSSEPFDNNTYLEARNFCASIGLCIDFSRMAKK